MTALRPLGNNIIFRFEDELSTAGGIKQFREKTQWGFDLMTNFDTNAKSARWSVVVATGPEVSDEVKEGSRILVEPLKWTEGVKFEEEFYWMTNEDCVLAIDDGE